MRAVSPHWLILAACFSLSKPTLLQLIGISRIGNVERKVVHYRITEMTVTESTLRKNANMFKLDTSGVPRRRCEFIPRGIFPCSTGSTSWATLVHAQGCHLRVLPSVASFCWTHRLPQGKRLNVILRHKSILGVSAEGCSLANAINCVMKFGLSR